MDLAVWRDVSLLWLIGLTLIPTLIVSAFLFYAIKGLRRLRQLTRNYLPPLREKAVLVADKTEAVSRRVVRPLIAAQVWTAQVNGIARSIFSRRKKV